MIKYLKYILLATLIILIIYLIVVYVDYSKKNNGNDVNNQYFENNEFSYELFDNLWYFSKILVYKNDSLLNETTVSGNSYIFLKDGYIDYCISSNDKCETVKYTYVDDELTISFDTLFPKGQYNVKIDGSVLKLSIINEDRTIVYVFECPLG